MKRRGQTTEQLGESRIRHMAERRGMRLHRSRRRDPTALDYGRYMLRDTNTRVIVAGTSTGRARWTLDDVEAYLSGNQARVQDYGVDQCSGMTSERSGPDQVASPRQKDSHLAVSETRHRTARESCVSRTPSLGLGLGTAVRD